MTAEPYVPLPPDPTVERTLPAGLYCPRCGHPAPCPKDHDNK